jgi:hypothetical protein
VVVLLVGVSFLYAPGCSFDPTGTAGSGDGVGGNGSDAGGGGNATDAGPGEPDADTGPVDCESGDTRCGSDGRTLQVCSEAGDAFEDSVPCPFSCEGSVGAAHCTLASNVPESAQNACTAAGASRLTPASGTVSIGDGTITCSQDCGSGSSTIAASGDAGDEPGVTYYCLSALDIPDGVQVDVPSTLVRAVVLFVTGEATVEGTISVAGTGGSETARGEPGPGGGLGASLANGNGTPGEGNCGGGGGTKEDQIAGDAAGGGGAGGGYGASGGDGGDGHDSAGQTGAGGNAGSSCGSPTLDPLIGGSGGGAGGDASCQGSCGWPGGGGGGAIQISAIRGVTITGTIDARGGNGFGVTSGDDARGGGGGGGSGGAVLLEGSALTIESGALVVEGGNGGAAAAGGGGGGGAQGVPTGAGGAGATANTQGGSGGGGSGGRVRLNATAAPSCAGVSSPDAVCSANALRRGGGIGGQ